MNNQSISCNCPNGHSFRVKPELAGRRVKCPKCLIVIRIPNENSIMQQKVFQNNTHIMPSIPKKSLQQKKIDWVLITLAICSSLFLLTTLTLFAILVLRGGNNQVVIADNTTQNSTNSSNKPKPINQNSTNTSNKPTTNTDNNSTDNKPTTNTNNNSTDNNPTTNTDNNSTDNNPTTNTDNKPTTNTDNPVASEESLYPPSKRGIEATLVDEKIGIYQANLSFGTVEVYLHPPIIWLAKDSSAYRGKHFCKVRFGSGRENDENNGVLNVNGKPVLVSKFAGSSNFSVDSDNFFSFDKPGPAVILIKIGNEQVWIPFEIREFPYAIETPAKEILTDIGFPTNKVSHFIEWPDTKILDSIIYKPSASRRIIATEHWTYDSLPHAVISISRDKLHAVGSN